MKKRHAASFKAKVALEAIKEEKTMAELSSQFGIHRAQLQEWKKVLKESLPMIFSSKKVKDKEAQNDLLDDLYRQIGILKVENEWLKKKYEI